jgi:beta-galactosidase
VTVNSASNPSGERIHIVHNWSWTHQRIRLPRPMRDVLAPNADAVEEVDLGAWDVCVVAA